MRHSVVIDTLIDAKIVWQVNEAFTSNVLSEV